MKKHWEVVAYADPSGHQAVGDPIMPCDNKRQAVSLAKSLAKHGYFGVEIHAHDGAEIIDGTIQYFWREARYDNRSH